MATSQIEYFPIAKASNLVEGIRIQMLLDRLGLPYTIRKDNLYSIYGNAAASLAGPMEFLVPIEWKGEAESRLLELFDIDFGHLPENCPACESKVPKGECDCPNCGLFLG